MKYSNTPTQIGNEKYRSKKEANRHQELLLLQRVGRITGLTREVPFVLAPKVHIKGESRARPAVRYMADFVYSTPDGATVVEDAKGIRTTAYRLKKHLMATVHNIHIVET